MNSLTKKTHTTPRNLTYTYYTHLPPSSSPSSRPTLLLCHGWPDTSSLWSKLLPTLLSYPLIIPDLLGYGGTSKPASPTSLYNIEDMCADLVSLLAAEGITRNVIVVGHDWGALFPSRLPMYHPSLVSGAVFLNVAPLKPTGPFNLEETLKAQTEVFGHPLFDYWRLFTSPEGPGLVEGNLEAFWDCLHSEGGKAMYETFIVEDGLRRWLEKDTRGPTAGYVTEEDKAEFVARIKSDGMTAPLNWYKAMADSEHWFGHDEKIEKARQKIGAPVLFVPCSRDAVCRREAVLAMKEEGFLPDLTEREIDSGHWLPMEKPEELGRVLTSWLREKF
ncbi:MAG: hypothetical protein Q9160_005416 [Pyrenula sp. 1 TL-2023]